MGLLDILAQVATGTATPEQHFDQVAQEAPTDALARGLAAAFGSNQTPNVGEMVGQLFGNSTSGQQAGMLNQILATLGPAAAGALAGGVLGRVMTPGANRITDDQAAQLTPDEARAVVTQANETHPGIIDQLGAFYAEHPTLVKTLGSLAMAIALSKMKDHLSQA